MDLTKKKNKTKKEKKREKQSRKATKLTVKTLKEQSKYTAVMFDNLMEKVKVFLKEYYDSFFKKNKESAVSIFIGIFLVAQVLVALSALVSIITVKPCILKWPLLVSVFFIVLPFGVWVWSTSIDYWCFHNRKRLFFYTCYTNVYLLFMLYVYNALYSRVLSCVDLVPVTVFLNEKEHAALAQNALLYMLIGIGFIIGYAMFDRKFVLDNIDEWVLYFKITRYIDTRKNKENLYDFEILHDLKTGKTLKVYENDRYTGTLVNGASGTGKTSTIFTTSIGNDLLKKMTNLEKLKQAIYELAVLGKVTLKSGCMEPVTHSGEFDGFSFEAAGANDDVIKENRKLLTELWDKYPNCGITAIAPNAGLPNDVIKICDTLGLQVNVVDPMPDEETGKYKENYTGINPFFVNPSLGEEEQLVDISEKAAMFADIMAAINDESGSTDQYFADINKSVTVNIAIINMAAARIESRQTDIFEMQKCINDFSKLAPLVDKIEKKYGVVATAEKKEDKRWEKQRSRKNREALNNMESDVPTLNIHDDIDTLDDAAEFGTSLLESATDSAEYDTNVVKLDAEADNPYYMVLFFVKNELLGNGAEKMWDQARGLRNQINNFLLNPHINRVFKYRERILDFDRMFREGEITVVNTALELGDSQSKAFGLYFILLFRQAMFRRPMSTRRTRHWCYIDELPVYLNAKMEALYSLARQYRVGFYSALQTLAQMEKNNTTKYLKGVLLGAGTHIVFGRVNTEEMQLYEALGGKKMVKHMKTTESGSSLLATDGSFSQSTATELKEEQVLQGTELRNRDFIELTFFTSENGNVTSPKIAKAHFIDYSIFDGIERKVLDWGSICVKPSVVLKDKDSNEVIHFPVDYQEYGPMDTYDTPRPLEESHQVTPEQLISDVAVQMAVTEAGDVGNNNTSVVTGPYPDEPKVASGAYSDNEMAYQEERLMLQGKLSEFSPNSSDLDEDWDDEMPDATYEEDDELAAGNDLEEIVDDTDFDDITRDEAEKEDHTDDDINADTSEETQQLTKEEMMELFKKVMNGEA